MANQNKIKRGNFINKNKLKASSGLVVFLGALIKIIFLHSKIENVGTGFYLTVFAFVMVIAMLLANTLREVVHKAVFYRKSRGQYKNAMKIMKTGAVLGFFAGLLIFLVIAFAAGRMTNAMFHLGAYGTFPMIILGASVPFLLFSYGVLGCFDGFSFEFADGAAKIIFGITDLLLSMALVTVACQMGEGHSRLLHDNYVVFSFGATGAAAGFTGACMLASLWLIFLFRVFNRKMRSMVNEDTSRVLESFGEQTVGLLSAALTPFARFLVLFGTLFLNQIFFFKNLKSLDASTQFGGYLSDHLLWFLFPACLTGILGVFSMDYLEKVMKKEDIYHAGMRIVMGIKQYLCTVLPMICILGIVYPALNEAFYKEAGQSVNLFSTLTISLLGADVLLCGMLKGIGKEWIGIFCGFGAFLAQAVLSVFIFQKKCDINGLFYCNLIFAVVFFLGCALFVAKFCVYKKHLSANLLMPFAALVSLCLAAVLCMMLKNVVGNIPAALAALFAAGILHAVTLVVTGCVRAGEVNDFPQGGVLSLLGRLLGIY